MKKVLSAECNLYYRESFLNILQTYVFQSFFFLQIENVCVRLELVEGGQADAPQQIYQSSGARGFGQRKMLSPLVHRNDQITPYKADTPNTKSEVSIWLTAVLGQAYLC